MPDGVNNGLLLPMLTNAPGSAANRRQNLPAHMQFGVPGLIPRFLATEVAKSAQRSSFTSAVARRTR
jgi:hypothetical protein